jgi:hypothetical protein
MAHPNKWIAHIRANWQTVVGLCLEGEAITRPRELNARMLRSRRDDNTAVRPD